MFCRNCGAQLKEGAAFCGKCGCAVVPTDVPGQPEQPEQPGQDADIRSEKGADSCLADSGKGIPERKDSPPVSKSSGKGRKLPVVLGGIAAVVVIAAGCVLYLRGQGGEGRGGIFGKKESEEVSQEESGIPEESGLPGESGALEGNGSTEGSGASGENNSAEGSGSLGENDSTEGSGVSGENGSPEGSGASGENPETLVTEEGNSKEENVPEESSWEPGAQDVLAALDAYQQYLDQRFGPGASDLYTCSIFYLDEDIIPEAVFWTTAEEAGPVLLAYDGQQVNVLEMEFTNPSSYAYVPKGNMVYFEGAPAELCSYEAIYSLAEGKWVPAAMAEYKYTEVNEEEEEPQLLCFWNSRECTYDECKFRLSEMFPEIIYYYYGNYNGSNSRASVMDAYLAVPEFVRQQETDHNAVLTALEAYQEYSAQHVSYDSPPENGYVRWDGEDYYGYEAVYIDEDEIPEVLLLGAYMREGMILTYDGSQVYRTSFGLLDGGIGYEVRRNRVETSMSGLHTEHDDYWKIENGQLVCTDHWEWEFSDFLYENPPYGSEYSYYLANVKNGEYIYKSESESSEYLSTWWGRNGLPRGTWNMYKFASIYLSYAVDGEDRELARQLLAPVSMSAVTEIAASSELTERSGTHYAGYICDGSLETAWVEGVGGTGEGEFVQISFDGLRLFSGFRINSGYQKSEDSYQKNARPHELVLEFSDGSVQSIALKDVFEQQTIEFSRPIVSSFVKIRLGSDSFVYQGTDYEDTCISEVEFF